MQRADVTFWRPICMLQERWHLVGGGWLLAGAEEQGGSMPCETNHLECPEATSGAAHEVLMHCSI